MATAKKKEIMEYGFNKDLVYLISKWFEKHTNLSEANYQLLKEYAEKKNIYLK